MGLFKTTVTVYAESPAVLFGGFMDDGAFRRQEPWGLGLTADSVSVSWARRHARLTWRHALA